MGAYEAIEGFNEVSENCDILGLSTLQKIEHINEKKPEYG